MGRRSVRKGKGITKEYGEVAVSRSFDFHYSEMTRLLEELDGKTRVLPKVEKNGSSDCPFARDLYDRKEAVEAEVRKKLDFLRRYQAAHDEEFKRCSRNLDTISANARSLNLSETKDGFDRAKYLQKSRYEELLVQRNALKELMAKASKALGSAGKKGFPGKKPVRHYATPASYGVPDSLPQDTGSFPHGRALDVVNPSVPAAGINPNAHTPVFRSELESLLAMGPVKGTKTGESNRGDKS